MLSKPSGSSGRSRQNHVEQVGIDPSVNVTVSNGWTQLRDRTLSVSSRAGKSHETVDALKERVEYTLLVW